MTTHPQQWREKIATVAVFFCIFAAVVPGWKALGNIGIGVLALTWLWCVVQQGYWATIQQSNGVSWLALSLFLWIVFTIGSSDRVSENWRAFFDYSALGKALLVGLFASTCCGSQRIIQSLHCLLLFLLFIMNARQIALMWHFQVLFDFTGRPFEGWWPIREGGQYLVLLLPFLFLAYVTVQRKCLKILLACWLGINVALLLVTGLRGGYLGFIIALLMWLWFSYRRRWIVALCASVSLLYLVVILWGPPNTNMYKAFKRGGSDSQRIALVWKPTLHMIKDAPLYGHGFGQQHFIDVYERYQRYYPSWTFIKLPDTHNVALSLGFAAGLPAMALYMMLFFAAMYALWRQRPRPREAQNVSTLFPLAVCCSWTALIGVLGQTDVIRWDYFVVLLILIAVCYRHRRRI